MLEFHRVLLSTPKTKELHFQWRLYLTIVMFLFVAPAWWTVIEFTYIHLCRTTTMPRLLLVETKIKELQLQRRWYLAIDYCHVVCCS